MKYIYLLSLFALYSCTQSKNVEKNIDTPEVIIETLDQKIQRHIEASLNIPATEKYTYETYSGKLDVDDSMDLVITVNQFDKAMNKAIEGGKLAKMAEMGFMGRYNHFFVMDGLTKEIGPAIPVPSSSKAKLVVNFENIRTEAYKDFTVDYKLSNSSFRRFFTVYNKLPKETFEIMIYDGLGDLENHAVSVEYAEGSYSLAKDILIYSGELEQVKFDDPSAIYDYQPEIKKTNLLERRWFYNDNQRKYFTKKDV